MKQQHKPGKLYDALRAAEREAVCRYMLKYRNLRKVAQEMGCSLRTLNNIMARNNLRSIKALHEGKTSYAQYLKLLELEDSNPESNVSVSA
jgi:DNA-directed RNA polymerase specialized sigma24 family protein